MLLGSVSVVGMVVEKICYEIGKSNLANYVSLATSCFIAITALQGVKTLLDFLGGF